MFRIINTVYVGEMRLVDAACNSNDAKLEADDFVQGSTLIETDTGNAYLYNEDASAGSKWVLVGGDE